MKLKMIRGIVFFVDVIILVIIKDKWSDYIIKFVRFFSLHSYSRRLHISLKPYVRATRQNQDHL